MCAGLVVTCQIGMVVMGIKCVSTSSRFLNQPNIPLRKYAMIARLYNAEFVSTYQAD